MKTRVRLFAGARQRAGSEWIEVNLPESATVGDLRDAICVQYPDLAPWAAHLMFAVDQQYCGDDQLLAAGADVACFPPVSGG